MKKIYFLSLVFLFYTMHLNAGAVRVMPLGDSITYDDSYADYEGNSRPASVRHAYRNYLWYKLRDAGYWVDFVGSRVAGTAVTPSFDPENEGYPGETSNYIASHVYGFLAANPADIVLLHIGTNDRLRIDSSGNYMSGMVNIFNEINRFESNYNHHVKIILALIIARRDNNHVDFTNTFNNNLYNLANSRISQGDDIYIVDMQHNAGLNYHSDFRDPAHPTDGGYAKMANVWYDALKRFLHDDSLAKPSNFRATDITEDSLILRWTDNSTNESKFFIYQDNQYIGDISANHTQAIIPILAPNTTYTFKIRAHNSTGDSEAVSVTVRTLEAAIPPHPTQAKVSNIDTKNATLHWTDTSKYEKGFKIYNGSKLIATLAKNTTHYTMKNLSPRETYTYKIVAYNDAGKSDPITITFTTKDDYGWLPAVYHTILY